MVIASSQAAVGLKVTTLVLHFHSDPALGHRGTSADVTRLGVAGTSPVSNAVGNRSDFRLGDAGAARVVGD